MSTIVGTNIEVTNIKYDSDTTSMIISNAGQVTIQGEGTNTTSLQQGLAKVWCCNNGDGAIYSSQSMNVSGTTDNGSADVTISYTNVFSSAYHTWGWTGGYDGGNSDASCRKRETTSDTGNLRYITCYAGTLYQWVEQSSTMHGDLA